MLKAADVRYPRVPSKLLPINSMLQCMGRLWTWQEQGDVAFLMLEGNGLAAAMVGGFAGNHDDPDIDVWMVHQTMP